MQNFKSMAIIFFISNRRMVYKRHCLDFLNLNTNFVLRWLNVHCISLWFVTWKPTTALQYWSLNEYGSHTSFQCQNEEWLVWRVKCLGYKEKNGPRYLWLCRFFVFFHAKQTGSRNWPSKKSRTLFWKSCEHIL